MGVVALVFLGYLGLAISIWPNIVPPSINLWQAAAPLTSQLFALMGALFIIPIILAYTFWSYHVFRGKVKAGMLTTDRAWCLGGASGWPVLYR